MATKKPVVPAVQAGTPDTAAIVAAVMAAMSAQGAAPAAPAAKKQSAKITVEETVFKGHPILTFAVPGSDGKLRNYSFGVSKVKLILDHAEAAKKFLAANQ